MITSGDVVHSDLLPEGWGIVVGVDRVYATVAALCLEKRDDLVALPDAGLKLESYSSNSGADAVFLACDPGCSRRLKLDSLSVIGGRIQENWLRTFLRRQGALLARHYYEVMERPREFEARVSPVPVSGKVWGSEEIANLVDVSLDFWLTTGRFNDEFEKKFAQFIGARYALTVNSGSSANLVALSALTSPKLKDRRLQPGDEVLTVAAGFPTTVTPIVQNRLVPVFVDVDPTTANVNVEQLEQAVSPKTKAIFLAHTLGNPFDIETVCALAKRHNLWLIEDSCDALDSLYTLNGESRKCGTFGDIGTFSFYPAHHMTMGEGGAVVTNNPLLRELLLSFRDWGRDCWCPPGCDNTCGRRYDLEFPKLPKGYDHKYVYSHLGYNLKITDMQAAVGLAQLARVPEFSKRRRQNFAHLSGRLAEWSGRGINIVQATANSDPSWFGALLTLAPDLDRLSLIQSLNRAKIGTRLLFAGNLTRQPCFEDVEFRAPFGLTHSDSLMERAFWVGVYQGLDISQIDYIADSIINWMDANVC